MATREIEAYKTSDGKDIQNEFKECEGFVSANSQVQAFNLDIERWLKEAHQISSIYFAFKNEQDGIKIKQYSNWHQWSLQQYKTILSYFETEISNGHDYYDYSEKANIIQNILSKIEKISTLEEKYIRFLHPGRLEFKAFKVGNPEPLKNITNNDYAEKVIKRFNKKLKKKHKKNCIKYIDALLSFEKKIEKPIFEELTQKLFSIIDDTDSKAFKKVVAKITSITFVSNLARLGYRLMRKQKYKESQDLFVKLLAIPVEATVESGFYTNILWVFQNDNTGLPTDKKRNKLALQKSLPKAKEYPHIFYNACCIYVEMKNHNKAYEMVEYALAHFVEKELMLNDIKKESLFKDFREKTNVLTLLENHGGEVNTNPKSRFISKSIAYERFKIHNIYNSGLEVDFTHILLINGSINIDDELNIIYKDAIEQITDFKKKILIIINGNVEAKSISELDKTELLIMGVLCNGLTRSKNVRERKRTNFDYTPIKIKKGVTGRANSREFDFETWGTGILENEISREVYHEFYESYAINGIESAEILKKFKANFIESYTDKGVPNSCDYWFAIGFALWELGALQKNILDKINDYNNKGRDKEKWLQLDVDDKVIAKRQAIVNQFLEKLKTPSKTNRRNEHPIIRPPVFKTGECIAVKRTDGSFGGFVVLGEINDLGECEMPANKIVITNIKQDNKPTKSDFIDAQIVKANIYEKENYAVFDYGSCEFYRDKNRFFYIDSLILNSKKSKQLKQQDLLTNWEDIQRYGDKKWIKETSLPNVCIEELLT